MALIRLILIVAVFYYLYKLLSKAVSPGPSLPKNRNNPDVIDDVMVQDPQCQVYFPLREGVAAVVDGKTVYFCSKECRDKYLSGRG